MSDLTNFFESDFSSDLKTWEDLLKGELKLADPGPKTFKKSTELGPWPVLGLKSSPFPELPLGRSWKKTSQTYAVVDLSSIQEELKEDLESGVLSFFFYKEALNDEKWQKIVSTLDSHKDQSEIEVILLGQMPFKIGATKTNVIDESDFSSGRFVHDLGGDSITELALMTLQLIRNLQSKSQDARIEVLVDSQFFKNIAKIRAAKMLALKVLETLKLSNEITLVALNSFRDWTFYERYTNILRNNVSLASAFIGGADIIQSVGYQFLFELNGVMDKEHHDRSRRIARNTAHVLSLESMLGVVQDAVSGSFQIDNLADHYATKAWGKMQEMLPLSEENLSRFIQKSCAPIVEERKEVLHLRKRIVSGINDFSNVKEKINLNNIPDFDFFRVSHHLESLRLQVENLKKKPSVYIGIFGDHATLNTRLNFIRNYFELIGLDVFEETDLQIIERKKEIVVICAADDDYSKLDLKLEARHQFVAGKIPVPGMINIFSGQNVFEVLEQLVKSWSKE